MLPEAEEWVDGLKIAKVTTWNHEKGPELDAAGFGSKALDDRIDFVCWGKNWLCNPIVQIGVYNSRPEEGPVDFTIRMRN